MAANIESIDTNLIVRIITGDVPDLRERAIRLLSDDTILYYVDDIAISESVYVLTHVYRYTRPEVAERILGFLSIATVKVDEQLFADVFEMFLKYPSLSFNDCYLSVKSARLGVEPLWTFDKKFATHSPTAKLLK